MTPFEAFQTIKTEARRMRQPTEKQLKKLLLALHRIGLTADEAGEALIILDIVSEDGTPWGAELRPLFSRLSREAA